MNQTQKQPSNILLILILVTILAFPLYCYNKGKKIESIKNESIENISGSIKPAEEYINNFTNAVNPKGYTDAETSRTFKIMMQKCSNEDIYDILFSDELKATTSYDQFQSYNINPFGIVSEKSTLLADKSVIITFSDMASNKGYGVIVKDKKITKFYEI